MVRLENIMDQFEVIKKYTLKDVAYIKTDELGRLILLKVMGKLPSSFSMKVEEMTLSGNEEL